MSAHPILAAKAKKGSFAVWEDHESDAFFLTNNIRI
jgi:hypothetical protein